MAKVRKEITTKVTNGVPVNMRTLNNAVKESLIDDNVKSFREIQDRLIDIYAKKNHDYGDSFNEGCNELGAGYAFSRIFDKTKRFQTLAKGFMNSNPSIEVKDETMEDTIMDLANYCVMYLAWINKDDIDIKHPSTGELKGSDNDIDNKVYIDISTNLKNEVVKLVHERTGATCTNRVLLNYGYDLVKDNNNYVYIENADGTHTSVTDDNCLVKVVPNK